MNIWIATFNLAWTPLQTRLPFRYGVATMTQVPQVFTELRLFIHQRPWEGVSSDCLPPKWFTKEPSRLIEEEIQDMLQVIAHAFTLARGAGEDLAFDLWMDLYLDQEAWASQEDIPPLLAHFGTSLVERALIEAVCLAEDCTFFEALQRNVFGVDLGVIHPELAGTTPHDWLDEKPLARVLARHTVGLSDPLTEADIAADERLEDGLPQSLEACIRHYGLRHFKIKLAGRTEEDLDRLSRIAAVIQEHAPGDFAFSLDGNEQFVAMEDFRDFWHKLVAAPGLRSFLEHLLFVEQPLHRQVALAPEVGKALRHWPDRPPLVTDESDARLSDVRQALELGYAGTSHKNCKGVFKGLAHACLLRKRRREHPGRLWLMTGEDLCNVGPVALHQDLAVMAALGIRSVERNGHHYHAGLSQFPKPIWKHVLTHHPDLYRQSEQGWPTLRIEQGEIDLGSINLAPFGVAFRVDLDLFRPLI